MQIYFTFFLKKNKNGEQKTKKHIKKERDLRSWVVLPGLEPGFTA